MAQNGTDKRRRECEFYPDFSPEMEEIGAKGVSTGLVRQIVEKHLPNGRYNRNMYDRYRAVELPIYERRPRFETEQYALNNRINNDFLGEIVDIKTGYFAGKAIGYSYSNTLESRRATGGEATASGEAAAGGEGTESGRGAAGGKDTTGDGGLAGGVAVAGRGNATGGRDLDGVAAAGKALTDFVARNNMYDLDMECTKYAACCGYAARLFYHDGEGLERVMAVPPWEAAVLSGTEMTEPFAAVRYYTRTEAAGREVMYAEYYDASPVVRLYKGEGAGGLELYGEAENLYGRCPLQGVPNNSEMMGDGEKVLTLIDAYDRAVSDAGNENESFANAYMLFENISITDEEMLAGQKAGAFRFFNGGGAPGKISFLTKDVNDDFMEHYIDRLEENIYRFSMTPNLNDLSFSQNASGVALKFKLTGLETKCGMFQAKMQSAGMYMFGLLAESWKKRRLYIDPLQCVMDFHRNFPLDLAGEAQAVGAMVEAGLPKRVAFAQLSFVEDVEYVLELLEEEEGVRHGGAEESEGLQPAENAVE